MEEEKEDYIYYSPWFRVAWNEEVFALGFGFQSWGVLGIYLGPISVFVGNCECD